MSDEKHLLLCSNGSHKGLPALRFGAGLAERLGSPVTLLGIIETDRQAREVTQLLSDTQTDLKRHGIDANLKILHGGFIDVLRQESTGEGQLLILGPLGQPTWRRWLRGTSYRHIAHEILAPLVYVPEDHTRLSHILLCLGGLGYARGAEQWAIFLAKQLAARITLLHVVEPIRYAYPTALEIQEHPGQILQTDTPQGSNLRQSLERVKAAGIESSFIERRGEVIHEILAEIKESDYDLVAMGSAESSTSLRHRYTPNVTAQIAENSPLPILAVRLGEEGISR